jgi:hypothetical protein
MTSSWKLMAWAIDRVISYRKPPKNNADFGRVGPNAAVKSWVTFVALRANGQQNTTEHEQKTKQKKTSPKPRSCFTM